MSHHKNVPIYNSSDYLGTTSYYWKDVDATLFNRYSLVPEAFLYLPVSRHVSLCVGAGLGPSWIGSMDVDSGVESNPGTTGRLEFGVDGTLPNADLRILLGVDNHRYSIQFGNRIVDRNTSTFSIRTLAGFSMALKKSVTATPAPKHQAVARPRSIHRAPSAASVRPTALAFESPSSATPESTASTSLKPSVHSEPIPDTSAASRRLATLTSHVQEFHAVSQRHPDPDSCSIRQVALAYQVDNSGRVLSWRILRSTSKNPYMDSDLGRFLSMLTFPENCQGKDSCQFLLPRDKRLLELSSFTAEHLPWTEVLADSGLKARLPAIRTLYASARDSDSEIEGDLRLSFDLAPGGTILSDTILGSSTGNEAFDNAVASLLGTTQFDTTLMRPAHFERTLRFQPTQAARNDFPRGWLIAGSISSSMQVDHILGLGRELTLLRTSPNWRLGASVGQEGLLRESDDTARNGDMITRTYLLPQAETFVQCGPYQALSLGLAIGPAWMSNPQREGLGYVARPNNPAFLARLVAGWDMLFDWFHLRIGMGADVQKWSAADAAGKDHRFSGMGYFCQFRIGVHFRSPRPSPSYGLDGGCPQPWWRVLPPAATVLLDTARWGDEQTEQSQPIASSIDSITGKRSSASVQRSIDRLRPEFRRTYVSFLRENPTLLGKITLQFEIAPSGSVHSLALAGSTTGDDALDREILDIARHLHFDRVSHGNATLTYTLELNPHEPAR